MRGVNFIKNVEAQRMAKNTAAQRGTRMIARKDIKI
jgi:hypothetical protein